MKEITITKDNGTTHRLINENFLTTSLRQQVDMVLTDLYEIVNIPFKWYNYL